MTLSLAKALKALKEGVKALFDWNMRKDSCSGLYADCNQVKNIRFKYESKLVEGRPVFKVKLSDQPRFAILKIARTYNIEMHQWCAERGLAPPLLAYSNTDGRHLVLMDYDESFKTAHDVNDASIKQLVLEKLTVLHSDEWVHGDCRPNNVLVSNDKQVVWFIDFDFSGKEGVAKYPPCMNMTGINWANGVKFGLHLHRDHDLHFWR